MCGIVAVADLKPVERSLVETKRWHACKDSLRRRGPDGWGEWYSPGANVLFGHARLAIVDLSAAGSQPMVSENGRLGITYNGELYNAAELRSILELCGCRFKSHCDTEVLIHAWKRWGPQMLTRFRGMYSFALWDEAQRVLFAAVDHAGMKPLVWKQRGERLYIASDCDSLRSVTGKTETLSSVGVRHVLTMSCCPPPETVWEGIYKLKPGHSLFWRPGEGVAIQRYYSPPECIASDSWEDQASFAEEIEGVVAEHLSADVPVGAFLSGGIDSSAVVSAAAANQYMIECYSMQMEGDADELSDARRVARRLGLSVSACKTRSQLAHTLQNYAQAYDEPQGYSAMLTMVDIASHASEHRKAVVGGDGGDEAYGGYLWQRETDYGAWPTWGTNKEFCSAQSTIERVVREPEADAHARVIARKVFGSYSFIHGYIARVFPGFHPAEVCAMTSSWESRYSHDDATQWLAPEDRPGMPHLRRVQRLDLVGFCAASILPKIDRGCMQYGLEMRSPLLDKRLIQRGLSAPVESCEMVCDGSRSRPHLREYVANALGKTSVLRPKQGFSIRRQDELEFWREAAKHIDEMKIIKQGILSKNWRAYVPHADMTRLRLICMLAWWAESRL